MDILTAPSGQNSLKSRETLITKVTAALTGQIGVFVIGSVSNIIFARILGPSGKGLFSLTVLAATMVMTLTHLSMSNANTHYMSKSLADRPAMIGNSLFIAFVWGMIVSIAGMYFYDSVARHYFPEVTRPLWGMAMAAVAPLILFEIAGGLVLGLDRMREYSAALIIRESLVLVGAAALYFSGMLSPTGAVAVWVISATAAGFYQLVIAWKGTGAAITVSGALLKRMAGYSFQSHIANVTTFLRLRLDMFLIAAYLNSQEVGYYGIAVSLIGLLWFMPTAIAQVLVPYISLRDHAVANDVTPRLCRVSVLVAVIGGIILAVLGKPILRLLYGAAYLPSYPALVVLVPGSVFYGIGKMLAGDLLGRGMPRYAMIISIVSLAANIGINIGLIPYWGIVGAALASSLTQILVGVLFMYYFVKASGTPVSDLFIFRRGDLRKLWHADRPR